MDNIILRLENISFKIKRKNKSLTILDKINLKIYEREIIGITGESGSGKTTLGKVICGLEKETSGEKYFRNQKFSGIEPQKRIQFLFQNYALTHDPLQSLNSSFDEILELKKVPKHLYNTLKTDVLKKVALEYSILNNYPSNLSGGELQRLAIAKLLLLKPDLVILDEPFASQDILSQDNIVNLLKKLNRELGITILIIAHDLPLLEKLCNRIIVMKDGKILEILKEENMFNPLLDYTKYLLEAFNE